MTRQPLEPTPINDKLILRLRDAASLLSTSEDGVRALIKSGDLGHVKMPRGMRVSRAQVAEYVERLESESAVVTANRRRFVARRQRPA